MKFWANSNREEKGIESTITPSNNYTSTIFTDKCKHKWYFSHELQIAILQSSYDHGGAFYMASWTTGTPYRIHY